MSKQRMVEEEIYTHEYLWRSSTALAARLDVDVEDAHHLFLPALLATFLAYEAFVNFCDHVLLPEVWKQEKENFKGKSLEYKVEVIAASLPNFVWRKGERPYQTIRGLSAFRDLVAHGKVQVNEYLAEHQDAGTHFTFAHAWDDYLTKERLCHFRTDTQLFCESLLVAMRHASDHPHLVFAAFDGSLASGESTSRVG